MGKKTEDSAASTADSHPQGPGSETDSGSTTAPSGSTIETKSGEEHLENDAPMNYASTYGMIDTHYYFNKTPRIEPGYDKGGPGTTKEEEQKRADTLREARTQLESNRMVTSVREVKGGRLVYVIRNGERLDRVFPEWLELAFTPEGKYRPYDLNQPLTMPNRPAKEEFRHDGPITEIGYVTSQMIGRAIKLNKISFSAIYVAPALRCIQTANGLLKTLGSDLTFRVEPGLFEFTGWYKTIGIPKWLTTTEMKKAGYRVDLNYKPFVSEKEIEKGETSGGHHSRVGKLVKKMLEKETGNVLIVGHGTTTDAIVRPLLGFTTSAVNHKEMEKMGSNYPYSSTIALREEAGAWKVIQDALPPATYIAFSNRIKFDFLNRP